MRAAMSLSELSQNRRRRENFDFGGEAVIFDGLDELRLFIGQKSQAHTALSESSQAPSDAL